jgi:DNA/RNA-binding domain of Phe-tRNA-synthetase-like protein
VIHVHHRIPRQDVALGLVRAEGVTGGPAPASLAAALDAAIAARRGAALTAATEARRGACRDILRNGKYKPTGRGKPASEYLLREATEGDFPRINGLVDANNLVSLAHLVPISLWDLDLAACAELEFRLGAAGEAYVFNLGGQTLDLTDLLVGCGLLGGASKPMVTPIKDSLATKTTPATTRVAAAIYWPTAAGDLDELARVTEELRRWLAVCGASPTSAVAVCRPGDTAAL